MATWPLGWRHILFLVCIFVILVISHLSLKGRILVLTVQVPGNYIPFTSFIKSPKDVLYQVSTLLLFAGTVK